MIQRERLLAIGGGLVLLTIAAIVIGNWVSGAFETRNEQLSVLEKEAAEKDRTVRAGERAVGQLRDFEKRSLPGDPSLAGSLYSQWLLNRAVEAGIAGPNVSPGPARPRGDVYVEHSFIVDGYADLSQVTKFLYQFYNTGYLHRIGRLNLTPVAGKKQLKLNLKIDALSLKNAPNVKELIPPPGTRLAGATLESYLDSILRRSLLGPANNPPSIATPGSQRANPSRSISFTVKGSDSDPLDKLSYYFEGTPPEGAKLDEKTGEFRWTPEKLGEYEVAIRVTDDGLPAKSAVEKVKIAVVEPPPPVVEVAKPTKLDFDPAAHAFLSAILQTNGKWQIWISMRTEGKVLRFEEGDKVSVGSINAVVKAIRPDEAELTLDGGGMMVVRIGKPLYVESAPTTGA